MKEYGYMEGAYLRSRFIEQIENRYIDKDGKECVEIVTEEEQIAQLSSEWKPVDKLDYEKISNPEEGFIVIPTPYDCGDHIGFKYEVKRDIQKILNEIQSIKNSLLDSDYKVMKCYEASLMNNSLPYDMNALYEERQKQRERINELEKIILDTRSQM